MGERWNTERIRAELGAASLQSVSRTLHRLGIRAIAREPGRSGMNLYDAAEVAAALGRRPGRGARTKIKGQTVGQPADNE